jgi:hypothetical protein
VRVYAVKTELLNASGDHLRYVPGAMAKAMVAAAHAEVASQNGKVKSIRLVTTASTHAQMTGPPSAPTIGSVRFTRRVRSDDHALVWWEHHPRCRDYE